jgi:Tfp pilus assembly protein PilF
MRSLQALIFLVSLSVVPALAQAGGGRRVSTPGRPRVPAPDVSPSTGIFVTGKVVVDDGSVLTESALIQTICRGQKRTEGHTDSHGGFSFQFGSRTSMNRDVDFDAETASSATPSGRSERRNLQDCELQASLAGFTSEVIQLGGRFSGDENADVGRVVLHRLSNVDGFTISATTAEAPTPARKALEKAQDQQKKGHLENAQKLLEKAVTLYPRFAVAWFELGLVQLQQQDPVAARKAFQQSIAADPKYINPYHGLTLLNQKEQRWRDLTEVSEKLLSLNPVSFPEAWLSNAIGHYFQSEFSAAEKSARRGLQLDQEHRLPRLEYMLAMVLLKKPDYQEATQHLRAFLQVTTQPSEIAEARKQLDEIARLSAGNVPVSNRQ